MTEKTTSWCKALGPFDSEQAVLDWLEENPEMGSRAKIHPVLGGGVFVMFPVDHSEGDPWPI